MVEFKIQLEERFVEAFSYAKIEKSLQDSMQKLTLTLAAQDILTDLETIDLQNDADWQVARNLALEQEKHKYVVSR